MLKSITNTWVDMINSQHHKLYLRILLYYSGVRYHLHTTLVKHFLKIIMYPPPTSFFSIAKEKFLHYSNPVFENNHNSLS